MVITTGTTLPFVDVPAHERAAAFVRRVSTNRTDIRDVALAGFDRSRALRVLDLGCGFGFMTEWLAQHLEPAAQIIGIDALAENRAPYMAQLERWGRRGTFVEQVIHDDLPWPEATFDLVVSSYSLYFFPAIIPAVRRVLAPQGRFLLITHSLSSLKALLAATGLPPEQAPLLPIVGRFCAENGRDLLAASFETVEACGFANSLKIESGDVLSLVDYIAFKLPLLAAIDPQTSSAAILAAVHDHLMARTPLVIAKDDAVFRCQVP